MGIIGSNSQRGGEVIGNLEIFPDFAFCCTASPIVIVIVIVIAIVIVVIAKGEEMSGMYASTLQQ